MDIGKRVRDAREARGMTQEELARRAGVPLNRVGRIETGTVTDPHYSTLSRIAGGLDVSVGELLQEPVPLGEAPSSASAEAAAPSIDVGKYVQVYKTSAGEVRQRVVTPAKSQVPQEADYRARAERREHDRFFASSMEGLALDGEGIAFELEEGLQRSDLRISMQAPLIFSRGYSFAGLHYEELALSGEVSEGLKRAKARLDEVNARIENLARRVISLGSDVVDPSALSDARQIEDLGANRRDVSRLQAEAEDRAARALQIQVSRQAERGF